MKIVTIDLIKDNQPIPYELLKLADPSIEKINQYLGTGNCYVARSKSEIVGVIVLNQVNKKTIEIKNIAVKESAQRNGIGKELIRFAENIALNNKYQKMRIGTGNSSLNQLRLYQKEGFEIVKVIKDFFIDNYSELIYEDEIQCKHMIVLEKVLNRKSKTF